MTTRLITGLACAATAALYAAPIELGLGMNGNVRVGDTGASIGMTIHHEAWNGSSMGARKDFKFPDAATGTANVEFFSNKELCATGRTTLLAMKDARALLTTSVTSCRDQKPESVVLTLELPVSTFAGCAWKASNGKSGVFEKLWNGKEIGIFTGDGISWIEYAPKGGDAFRLTFPGAAHVMMQDNRKWSTQTVSARISFDAGRSFNKGDQHAFTAILSTKDGMTVAIDKPVVLKAGDEWIPLDYRKDVEAGSAVDFSNQGLQDAPAGKHGWLKNVNGHFEFENLPGKKQRFYGVNLCFEASFPDHAMADKIVTRLVRLGYNTVRIHHYESDGGVIKGAKDGLTLNPERMDKFDYLLAKCFEKGIYVTTDMFTCRPVMWRDIGINQDGRVDQQVYKNMILVHRGAYKNWETFTRNMLTHVNKYTGRAYKDEPGLPLISLINEGHLNWCWHKIKYDNAMKAAWRTWITEKRKADPEFAKGVSVDAANTVPSTAAVMMFMADLERKFMTRQRAFLKELGVKALITNQNCGGHYTPMMEVREEFYDYVDDHFYVDHPHFLANPWSLPSKCGNANPVFASKLAPVCAAYTRMPTKPFTITEWNFSGPGMYRGVGGIMTGAMSALQDWDGLWRFAYSHGLYNMDDRKGFPGYFDTASDPLGQAGDRASVCLFLRGDLRPLEDMVVNQITPDTFMPKDGQPTWVGPGWIDDAWMIRTATAMNPIEGAKNLVLKEQLSKKEAPVTLKPNPAIELDRERGSFRIVTEKTAGAFVPSGSIKAGAVEFTASDTPTTVWASSLDGKAIGDSRRILVTHVTDVQANGNVYADKAKTVLLKWGSYPPIVRNGEAKVSLALAKPGDYAVWALESSGRRLEKMPCAVRDGKLEFTAAVKGPNGARMLYEIVAE